MRASFYYGDGYTEERRRGVLRCYTAFERLFGDQLRLKTNPNSGKFSRYRGAASGAMAEYLSTLRKGVGYEYLFQSGEAAWEAGQYQFWTYCASEGGRPGGTTAFSVPFDWFARDPAGYLTLFQEFVAALQPFHAAADLSILQSPTRARDAAHQQVECQWAERHRGLDVEDSFDVRYFGLEETGIFPPQPFRWADCPQAKWLKIKGFNWLFYGNRETIEQAGGEDLLRRIGSDHEIRFTRLAEGLMVQAGPHPRLLGPHEPIPLCYRQLNIMLKPLRIDEIHVHNNGREPGWGGFDRDRSRAWQRRFDE